MVKKKEYAIAQGYPSFVKSLIKDFPEEAELRLNIYATEMEMIAKKFSIFEFNKVRMFLKNLNA
jgi:hypothetical protein